MVQSISQAQARRIALHAQGLSRPRREIVPTRRDVLKLADRLNLFQIDSVSVLVRAHYMPLFSRLGPYAPALLEDAAKGRRRGLFEYWAHEASFLPLSAWPLMQWRMARARDGKGIYGGLATFGRERPDMIQSTELVGLPHTSPLKLACSCVSSTAARTTAESKKCSLSSPCIGCMDPRL